MADRIRAFRPADLFQAEIELINLGLSSTGDKLVRLTTTAPAYVVLHLPYQHVREPASSVRIPTPAAAAGPSTLAFELPNGVYELVLGGNLLLALDRLPPAKWRSIVELPGRVQNWLYDNGPWHLGGRLATAAGRTDLWRADLSGTVLNAAGWRDSGITSWESVPSAAQLRPLRHGYFSTDGLTLSPFGATTRLAGPFSYDLVYEAQVPDWREHLGTYDHVMSLGRDSRVRVTAFGYLTSGHRAVVTTTRTRVMAAAGSGAYRARLIDTACLMVSRPDVDFDALGAAYRHGGREMPLRRLRVLLERTPPLSPPNLQALQQNQPFWVESASGRIEFPMCGTDWADADSLFAMPLMFVPDAVAGDFGRVAAVHRAGGELRRSLGGQSFAVARPDGAEPATVPVESLTFDVEPVATAVPDYRPGFVLTVPRLAVYLPALAHFSGTHDPVETTLHPLYLSGGANPAGAFLDLVSPVPVPFAGAGGGGLARPSTVVAAATTRDGVVPRGFDRPGAAPDLDALFGGAKILGFVPLADLLDTVGLDAPKLTVTGTSVQYRWEPKLRARPGRPSKLMVDIDGPTRLLLQVTVDRPADGAPPTARIDGRLTNVAFGLAGIATVRFTTLAFTSRPGRAPEVTCTGFALTFAGALEFLNTLRSLLPSTFAGVELVVTEDGIVVRHALTVPSAGVGVAALTNLALRTELRIPFSDSPTTLRFALSERHHPFIVTVGLFGGGGFFALEATTDGVRSLEAAIEFGGSFSLDIGVATGGVYLMAGVYFALHGGECVLSGYVRCGGYVSVLGIVSISVEFYLGLQFRKDHDTGDTEVWGQASVTVGIQVLLFSTSVTLPFERRFAGAPGDPPFADCVTPADWDTFCLAFA